MQPLDLVLDGSGRLLAAPGRERGDQRRMIVPQLGAAAAHQAGVMDHALALVPQRREHVGEPLIAAGGHDREMQLAVRLQEGRLARRIAGDETGVAHRIELAQPVDVGAPGRVARRGRLEHAAQRKNLADVAQRDRLHQVAAARQRLHPAALAEAYQRAADRRLAEPVARGKLGLRHARSRRDAARHDVGAQHLEGDRALLRFGVGNRFLDQPGGIKHRAFPFPVDTQPA